MSEVRSRRSFVVWFLVAILLINSYAAIQFVQWLRQHGLQPQVRAVFTAGTHSVVTNAEPLEWSFSEQIVAPRAIGVWRATGPVSIAPQVSGRFQWRDSRTLIFEPAKAWPACTQFSAIFDKTFAQRHKLRKTTYAFATPALALVGIRQLNVDDDRRLTLALDFNARPDVQRLKEFVRIVCDGTIIAYQIVNAATPRSLIILTEPLVRDEYSVNVAKDLPSLDGPNGMAQAVNLSGSVEARVELVSCKGDSAAFAPGTIAAQFNTALELADARNFVAVDPPVAFSIGRLHGWSSSGLTLSGEFQPGARYVVTFRQGLKAANGKTLSKDVQRTVYMPDRPADLAFTLEGNQLSPRGGLLVPLSAVNVPKATLTLERVYPNNLVLYAARTTGGMNEPRWAWNDDEHGGLSHLVGTREVMLSAPRNVVTQHYVQVRSLMGATGAGAFLLSASAERAGTARQLLIVSDLGIAAHVSPHDIFVWINSLRELTPVSGVVVRVHSLENQELYRGVTDAEGRVHFFGDMTAAYHVPFVITAEAGDDVPYLSLSAPGLPMDGDASMRAYLGSGCEAYIYSDRGVYRPGEVVHLKAVLRTRDLQCPRPCPVAVRVTRPDGRVWRTLTAMLNDVGAAVFELELPTYAQTGRYGFDVLYPGGTLVLGTSDVLVEDFVPPQIRAQVDAGTNRAHADFTITVTAEHLFGKPAAELPVNAAVTFDSVAFSHARWPDYCFNDDEKDGIHRTIALGTEKLDAQGRRQFTVPVDRRLQPPSALRALTRATVREAGGRAVAAYAARFVDVYPFYLGLRLKPARDVVDVGVPLGVSVAAITPDGAPAATVLTACVRSAQVQWSSGMRKQADGRYRYESTRSLVPISETLLLLSNGEAVCTLTFDTAGSYVISVTTPESGVSASRQVYAGDAATRWLSTSLEAPTRIELVPDKSTYRIGDVARIVARAPFSGRALVTLETDRVLTNQVIMLQGNSTTIDVPIESNHAPNVYCVMNVIRPVQADDALGIYRARGCVSLAVRRPEARAELALHAPALARPMTCITAEVAMAATAPAFDVALAAVDEGICLVTDFTPPDPLAYFEQPRRLDVGAWDVYNRIMPEIGARALGTQSSPGGDGMAGPELAQRLSPVDARRFKPVALWHGSVRCDSNGHARIPLDLPEFSGTLRLMATAIGTTQMAATNMTMTVKRPIVMRSSLPRFLAPTDRCRMTVQLFNEMAHAEEITLSCRIAGPAHVSPSSLSTTLPANAQCTLSFDLTAALTPGVARVTLHLGADTDSFQETIELPVRPAVPRTTVADVLTIASGSVARISLPTTWLPGTACNVVVCSALPDVTLAGGLDFLLDYPHGCIEQRVSAALPLLYVADLAAALQPGSVTRADAAQLVQAAILRVITMQTYSGGFPAWPDQRAVYAWGSCYALQFLLEADAAGYDVPREQLDAALNWAERFLATHTPVRTPANEQAWFDDLCTRSYACYVLAKGGRVPHSWLARLQEQRAELDAPTLLNVVGALTAADQRRDAVTLLESIMDLPVLAAPRQEGGCLNSDARTAAMMLNAWLDLDPSSAHVPALVHRLNSFRSNGCWRTTQENAAALLALGKYVRRALAARQPLQAVAVWNGGTKTWAFDDTAMRRIEPDPAAGADVIISNAGPGTLFVAWHSSGVPANDSLPEGDHQLLVRRALLDQNGRALTTDTVAQGDLLVVRLTLDARSTPRSNVVIDDLLPAGFELENADLRTAESVPWIERQQALRADHLEQRDDRVIFFFDEVRGSNTYFYAVRAVTPGTYRQPPVRAECMYDPTVRSVHDAGQITVE